MPRKSIVKTLIENYTEKEVNIPSGPIEYLILYKFHSNPSPRFYNSLEGLEIYFEITRAQKGVLKVKSLNVANLVISLIGRYKGTCQLYSASEVQLRELFANFGFINWSGTGIRT
jgi:hypothetical protein